MSATPEKEHLFAEERQDRILTLLQQEGKLLIPALCEAFSVSPATIRNDLNDLERRGLLQRTHGGAIAISKTGFEPNFLQKQVKNSRQKEAIAEAAASYVEDGDTLVIDTGTTALAFAAALSGKHDLTVLTNDIKVAALLDEQTDNTVILTGGTIRRNFFCTLGPLVTQSLRQFRADKCFLATNGLSAAAGLTTPDLGQAEIKRLMAEISSQVFVLCDSSKVGVDAFVTVLPLNKVDTVITDAGIDPEEQTALQACGTELVVVQTI